MSITCRHLIFLVESKWIELTLYLAVQESEPVLFRHLKPGPVRQVSESRPSLQCIQSIFCVAKRFDYVIVLSKQCKHSQYGLSRGDVLLWHRHRRVVFSET